MEANIYNVNKESTLLTGSQTDANKNKFDTQEIEQVIT